MNWGCWRREPLSRAAWVALGRKTPEKRRKRGWEPFHNNGSKKAPDPFPPQTEKNNPDGIRQRHDIAPASGLRA